MICALVLHGLGFIGDGVATLHALQRAAVRTLHFCKRTGVGDLGGREGIGVFGMIWDADEVWVLWVLVGRCLVMRWMFGCHGGRMEERERDCE